MRSSSWSFVLVALWAWCGIAVATRIDLFGVHGWGGHRNFLDLAASPIEMSIWFSPIAVFSALNEQANDGSYLDKNALNLGQNSCVRTTGARLWDILFAMVTWGFLGLVMGLAALIPPILILSTCFGEDAGSALFRLVCAVE